MKLHFPAMKTTASIALCALVALTACRKDRSSNDDNSTAVSLAGASSASQSVYDDAFDVITTEGESSNVSRVATCAVVTLSPNDTITFPKTMTIDFGSGCTSVNGITRKGKIVATLSGKLKKTGTTISVALTNYYVNDYHVEGTYSITNNSGSGNGLNYTTAINGGKLTYPDGAWYTYTGTHTLAQTNGIGTVTVNDDVYSWSGGFTTSSSAGNSLSGSISTPLTKSMACKNIISGVETFTYNGISGTINYGDGSCDNLATLTIGASTKTIILPR